jgi:hypothetical protein
MSSALFAFAYMILIAAVSYLAYHSHIPGPYVFTIDLIMVWIGVMTGIENARQKDSNY